jgi:integrase
MRFLEFFAANIRNPHTRRAYARAADEFLAWCASVGVPSIGAVQPVRVASWIEAGTREFAAPSVKQRLATIHHLFRLARDRPRRAGQPGRLGAQAPARRHLQANAGARSFGSARAVHSPASVRRSAWRSRMSTRRTAGSGYGCARRAASATRCRATTTSRNISPPVSMAQTCAVIPGGPLFRTIGGGTGNLTRTVVLPQANAYAMIRRRAAAAGIATRLGNHSFRATGITTYLKNGGTLEKAAAMANHASTRTTQLYDRRRDEVSLDEVERIVI